MLIPKVEVGGLDIRGVEVEVRKPVSFSFTNSETWHGSMVDVIASMMVIERNGRHPIRIHTGETFPVDVWERMSPKWRAETIRGVVTKLLLHELDEQLKVDGELVREPHPEGDR